MTTGSLGTVDIERWRRKYDLIKQAARAHSRTVEEWAAIDETRGARCAEVRALIDRFRSDGDLAEFRTGVDAWSRAEGAFHAFRGFGLMWLNQLAKHDGDQAPAIVEALRFGLETPKSVPDALSKLERLESAIAPIRASGQPAAGRKAFVLSLFWSTDPADNTWPCLWPSAADGLRRLGWTRSWDNDEIYPFFREVSLALEPADPHFTERCLWFLEKRQGFVGLAPALREICVEASDLLVAHSRNGAYLDEDQESRAKDLASQLTGEMKLTVSALENGMRDATGLELTTALPQLKTSFDASKPYRADTYGNWSTPGGMDAPSLRLWATRSGVAFGVHAGFMTQETATDLAREIENRLAPQQSFFHLQRHDSGDRLARRSSTYESGEIFVGWWWDDDAALGDPTLGTDLVKKAAQLKPLVQLCNAAQRRATSAEGTSARTVTAAVDTGWLAGRAEAFRKQRPYPTDKDAVHQERRGEFAQAMTAEALGDLDFTLFRRMYNGNGYGAPGPQARLNRSFNEMTAAELDTFGAELREFLWGDEPVEQRLTRALDREILNIKGLGESVLMKMLAVVHPDRFLPVFPLNGDMGKEAVLQRLGLAVPQAGHPATRQIQANDQIRELLEPLFPGDAWAQGQFAYWLTREEESPAIEQDLVAGLADRLFVPGIFLDEVRDLLQERKQVIFYGPPGTGKTYIARELAAALQPDPLRRRTVQFHPSTSYEDFFEGFRPRLDDAGVMSYELRKGPLALLVDKAENDPTTPHVLLIDEINRANLPRVLGELLFLLEYRKEFVYTTYRPDEPFQLPDNLLIIGTMNTADRSIAMVDAALRRRFHFIPFMPHEGPLSGVLHKYLDKHSGPTWVAGLVDAVNERLRVELKGPHLQIGHSHFMRTDLDAGVLQRIWTYGVYPMIEDQLYGREGLLETFTWSRVLKDYGPGSAAAAETSAESEALAIDDQAH